MQAILRQKLCLTVLIATTLLSVVLYLTRTRSDVQPSKRYVDLDVQPPSLYTTTSLLHGFTVKDSTGSEELNQSIVSCPRGPPCTDFLTSEFDMRMYHQCYNKVKRMLGTNVTVQDNGCRFIPNQTRGAVALASFPGSGNTWLRTIIEHTTGVCTGSYCCDMSLRYKGFSGENIRSGKVMVVKTHALSVWVDEKPAEDTDLIFQSAIVIIRNPFDALVSEWNRKVANGFNITTVRLGTHVANAGREYFGKNKQWTKFLNGIHHWVGIIEHWVLGGLKQRKKVLVVHYEDLKENKTKIVKKILDFLNVDYSEKELQLKLRERDDRFHRKHIQDFDHFTIEQRDFVNHVLGNTQYMLRTSKLQHGVQNVAEKYSNGTSE